MKTTLFKELLIVSFPCSRHSVVLGEHTKGQDIDCNIYHNSKGEEIERDCAGPIEEFGIESFDVHQDYNRPKYSNDIGLIRLDKDVTMNGKYHMKQILFLDMFVKLRIISLQIT